MNGWPRKSQDTKLKEARPPDMIRIRFHGRGGHGVKTASRIVGTAAFLAGHYVQDSPIYGAERRGAPVVAFTRIHDSPILERGVITQPDLIICGDDTLLELPDGGVLQGAATASGLFINTSDLKALKQPEDFPAHTVSLDVTQKAVHWLGQGSLLSTGLGAAAARLAGMITWEQLNQALTEELTGLGVDSKGIENNLGLGCEIFESLNPVTFRVFETTSGEHMFPMSYDPVLLSTPSILAPGNTEERKTGAWRTERPEIDLDRCTRCGLCFVHCPDGAIALDDQGYPIIDYQHCKGCLICLEQCRPHAITSRPEKGVS